MFVSAEAQTLQPADVLRATTRAPLCEPRASRSSQDVTVRHLGFGKGRGCVALATDTRISEADRSHCVQLLKKIATDLEFHFKVFEQSVMIFEGASQLLASSSSKRNRKLLSISCMILALKFEGTYGEEWLDIPRAVEAFGEQVDPSEFERLEFRVLGLLNWRLRLPSPNEMAVELLSAAHRVCTGEDCCPDSDCVDYINRFIGACLEYAPVARSCSPFSIAVASVSAGLETVRSLELSAASVLEASKCEAFDMVAVRNARPKQKLLGSSCSD